MHKKFDNKAIEKKWQKRWKESGIYDVGERDSSKEKEYVLVELPYPSGNLHIGHWYAFAVPDIYVRFGRMMGKQMLYPMGFDAFGLPAENAAIKRNINPKEWTKSNISHMRDQLGTMGASFSWDKEANTTDPEYYKWTQWMFIEFFKNKLAYRGTSIVNWCPSCNTVIANEQVVSGVEADECERCASQIERKEMPQWMLRITKYADRLLDDLEGLDWPEPIKEAQRQWIGRSEGALLKFKVENKKSKVDVEVFTTRPDTLYGATYLVLAPEHSLITEFKASITNWDEVYRCIDVSKKKTEQDRLDDTKEKTGVKLEGITAINPASGEEIPVYIADYVLASYGTGAIMAVPAHDKRDFEFARKFNLNITPVVTTSGSVQAGWTMEKYANEWNDYYSNTGKLVNSAEFTGMDSEEAKKAITEKVGGKMTHTYRLRDWSVGRQRYWGVPIPIVYDLDGKAHPIPEEHLPWTLPEDVDFKPTGEPPLVKSKELKKRTEEIFGKGWTPEVETMDTFLDSSWYFLRYIDNKNESCASSFDRQKDWMPIDIYFGGAEHTTMHLLYSRFWQKALLDLGYVNDSEPYKKRINRGLVLGPDGNKMSKSKGNVIDPDEQVERVGADAVKMYLAFMGPYGEVNNYPWDMGGIVGLRRFLERVYGLSEHIVDTESEAITKQLHKTIQKVNIDIPKYKFNTAISAMMIFVNKAEKEGLTQETYETFLRVLAPFATHLTEELWEETGKKTSIHLESFPEVDKELIKDDEVTIGVQVNGKLRGSITLATDTTETEAVEMALDEDGIKRHLSGKPDKVVYIPAKILNLILK